MTPSPLPLGVSVRLRTLFHEASGRALIVALDHGLAGILPGAEDPLAVLDSLRGAPVEGVIVSAGVAVRAGDFFCAPNAPRLVVSIDAPLFSAVPGALGALLGTAATTSVRQALALGASAVKIFLPVGLDDVHGYRRSVEFVAQQVEMAHADGVPVMVEPALWGASLPEDHQETLVHAARVAMELGADLIKTETPKDDDPLQRLVARSAVPVLFMGGNVASAAELTAQVARSLRAGAAGIVVGRNVWSREKPGLAVEALAELVRHDDDARCVEKLTSAGEQ